jgi:beta-lactamase regulating signal transducer with metallopeptidase domain
MVFYLTGIFLAILNMSITACFVILIVLFIRMLLRKAPKIFSYGLWGIVFFRLMCPFSVSSAFSLLRFFPETAGRLPSAGYSPGTVGIAGTGILTDTAPGVQRTVTLLQSGALPQSAPDSYLDQGQLLLTAFSMLWLLGTACLFCYGIWSYAKLKATLSTAVKTEENVFESESVPSPCVVGFLRPGIYLPLGIAGHERQYILRHERIHIRRLDHLLRPLAYFALCLHWFNPLVWLSFRLMARDMEMSCDESVLKEMGSDIKKAYSSSLLSFAVEGRRFSGSPLAFGEENVGRRIRNVLNYRRPPAWIAFAILLILAVSAIGLLTDPDIKSALEDQPTEVSFTAQELRPMAEIWAESLKTRDGEPRYRMMSDEMKERFIKGQKERSEPWNFNIGVSSPWVTSYKVTISGDTAEITYTLTDSTQATYEQKEILHFGKEHGKTVVVQADELLSDWDRYSYHAPTAAEAFAAYKKALLESDYRAILALTPSAKLDPYGQIIWDTVSISKVSVVSQDIRRNKACYELELTIKDGGSSAFESGISPRWLWLAKDELGWYAEGLMTGGAPDTEWWDQAVSADPFSGENERTEATYGFEKLLYLSPLSSSMFEFAENRMKEAQCSIGADHFSIDNPKEKEHYEVTNPIYVKSELTEKMAADFEESTFGKISVADYSVKQRYKIRTEGNKNTNYCLYVMDNELWLASYTDNTADGSEITMALWKLS